MGDQKQDQCSPPGKDSLTQSHEQEINESSDLSPKKEKNDHLGLGSFKRAFSWKNKLDVMSGDQLGEEKRFMRKISHPFLSSFRKVPEEETDRLRQQFSSKTEVLQEKSKTDSSSKPLPVRTKDPPQEKQSTPSIPCSTTLSQRSKKPSEDATNSHPGKEEDAVLGLSNFKRSFLRMSSKREGTTGGQAADESSLRSRLFRSFRKNEEEATHRPLRSPKGSQWSPKEDSLGNMMEVEEEKPVSDLIAERQLLKAFTQLCQLEASLMEDQNLGKFKDDPTAYARQAMDICVHYDVMAAEIRNIVGETLSQPSVDPEALSDLAQLIKEEEGVHSGDARDSAFLRAPRRWRHLWEEAVKKSTSDRVEKVGQGMSEPTLASLLSELGRVIKQDLVKIRHEVQPCYPEDFLVWNTYVDAFHGAVSARLQELLQDTQGFEKLYVIMDWVANVYCSKDFLGSLDLELDMTTMPKLLAPDVWEKLESDYTKFLETKIKSCFDSILKLEVDRWSERKSPELLQDLYHSPISIDIHMLIGEHVNTARAISSGLEVTTLQILEQSLNEFIHRFEKRFMDSEIAKEQTLFLPYLCAYISAFQELKTNLPAKFLNSFTNMGTTLSGAISRFKKEMLIHLHRETQILFKDVGSKAWVTTDKLQPIMEKTVTFAQYLKHLVQPHNQECLQETHCYVVREYVAHVLRPRERLRGEDRIASAQKMSQESDAINSTFQSLGSEATWLGLAIPCISEILGETYKEDIRKHIETLIRGYPDIRQEHVAAILALRNLGRRRNNVLLRHAQDLLKKAPKTLPGQGFFGEIDVPSSVEVLLTCI